MKKFYNHFEIKLLFQSNHSNRFNHSITIQNADMENNFLLTDDRLWDYADGFLEGAEKLQVEAYLQQHPDQWKRLEAIQGEKRALAALPLEKPQAGFADRVMAAWVAEQSYTRALAAAKPYDRILLSIAGAFGVFLILAFILAISMAPEVVPLNIPTQYIPSMPVVNWALLFDNVIFRNAMILILALLTLQILDKYLQQRNQQQRLLPGQ